jgi:hypothetical protein
VRRDPKGADDGGTVELTEGGGGTMAWRHDDGSLVGWRRHEAEEREEGATECRARTREGGREGKQKRGAAATGCPL